jgi:hypothetical protein
MLRLCAVSEHAANSRGRPYKSITGQRRPGSRSDLGVHFCLDGFSHGKLTSKSTSYVELEFEGF